MNASPLAAPRFGLGAIDQISFAVRSVDEAVNRYSAMFGANFAIVDVLDLAVKVRGHPASATLRLGFGRSGNIEVELVEVVNGLWPTASWLDQQGEGLHHIRFPVKDVATSREEMTAEGFTVTLESDDGCSFSYLESPLLNGMTVELIDVSLT